MATQEDKLDMGKEFREKTKKLVVLWERVLQNIKSIDDTFSFSRDEIYRKFVNFMVTYKRIKKRNKTSGEATTTWYFYDRLDEVYGCRSDIPVPESNLESSLDTLLADLTEDSNEPSASQAAPIQRESSPSARNRVDIVEFLTKESQAYKKLLEDVLNCEKEKLKIEKEKRMEKDEM